MVKKPTKKTLTKKSKKKPVVKIVEDGSDTEYANDGDMYNDSDSDSNEKNNVNSEKENDDEVDDDDKFGDDMDEGNEEKEKEDEDEEGDENDDKEDNLNEYQEDGKCFYKYAHKKNDFSDDEEDDDDDGLDNLDDIESNNSIKFVTGANRITKARLTKYENVRLLTDRTKQLSLGAKPMIKNVESLSDLKIAHLEIKHNMIPLIIERPLPNGNIEVWKISELSH